MRILGMNSRVLVVVSFHSLCLARKQESSGAETRSSGNSWMLHPIGWASKSECHTKHILFAAPALPYARVNTFFSALIQQPFVRL